MVFPFFKGFKMPVNKSYWGVLLMNYLKKNSAQRNWINI